ncbi:MAG TPA: hypothetical protein VFJ82_19360 [Longimicrobium sp.]|nr:hypothetical protein [Longimicrobium sp.]
MNDTLEFPYRPNPKSMLLAILFFGACAAMMARAALTNDRGLILNGVITFSEHGATVFYGSVAGVAALFVAAGAWGLLAGRGTPRFVRLTPAELSAPRNGFTREPTVIRLRDIQGVSVQAIQRQRLLTIQHPGGKLSIAQSMLPGAAAFDELCAALGARLEAVAGAGRQAAGRA